MARQDAFDTQSAQYRLELLPVAFDRNGIVFSKTVAAKLVGGRTRLGRLIERGEIRVEKRAMGKQNGKWYCTGGDVLRHVKI